MTLLTLRSLRHRTGAFTASFLAMFLGAAILMTFGSMLDTAGGEGVDSTSEETLVTMASIVGFWGLLLVVFAVTSTLTLAVRQRTTEMALLKSVGATPAQIGRMITGETVVVALAASLLAIPLGLVGGRVLLSLLKDTDQVAGGVDHAFGTIGIGMGIGITLVSATLAAAITARRTARMKVAGALLDAETGESRMGRARIVFGVLFLVVGIYLAGMTSTVMHGKGSDAMQTAGSTSIFTALGIAMFGPVLVRRVTALFGGVLESRGATGHLSVRNLRRRAGRAAAVLTPIILFVGIATGTLYMQSIDNAAASAEGLVKTNEQKNIETLNFVVIGMIVVFACILLINTLVAGVTDRRAEFARQRLAGATPRQVLGTVGLEGAVLAVAGIVLGTLAGLATVLPYSYARTDSVLPDTGLWTWLGIIAVAAVVTLGTGHLAARRAIGTPAVSVVAG